MSKRVAIYARFSTDKQSETSAEDQAALCREWAEREGWHVVDVFADLAMSGATRNRPGLNALLERVGEFDLVLAESIDRLSRDQEDIAAIHKRLRFAGVEMVTLADGDVSELHIGLKGTMAALFLRDLAQKTRRGQIGRVAAGRIPGGLSYGYRKLVRLDARGEPERGLREIDPAEAEVIRGIFTDYLGGTSPREIAMRLNARGIPAPRGGPWRASTIIGHRQRRNGILNNELYAGRIVYNRQRMLRDPLTGKRISRLNPKEEWKTAEVEALRIVDQAAYDRVDERLASRAGIQPVRQRRPKRLLSGLLVCGKCGGPVTIISTERWGCSARKETGACGNGRTITTSVLEQRVLGALREQMLAPDYVKAYVAEYHRARAEGQAAQRAGRARLERRLSDAEARMRRLAAAIADNVMEAADARELIASIRTERDACRAELDSIAAADDVIALHPGAGEIYRRRIEDLSEALKGSDEKREKARAGIRALIDCIVVRPRENGRGVDLELQGRLAELLNMAKGRPHDRTGPADCTVKLVAGARIGLWSTLSVVKC